MIPNKLNSMRVNEMLYINPSVVLVNNIGRLLNFIFLSVSIMTLTFAQITDVLLIIIFIITLIIICFKKTTLQS